MIAADGVEEAPRLGPGAPGRHAAWNPADQRRAQARRPVAWIVAPAVLSAVFAGAAVVVVVNGARSAGYHIAGGTMTAVWALGALILAVVVGTLALAGRAAAREAGFGSFPEPDQRSFAGPGSGYAHPQPQPHMPRPVPAPMPAPPPEVAANAAEAAAVMAAVNSAAAASDEGVDLQVIFAQLVRRLLTLVLQQINRLDELENEVEDPKLLKSLFGIDHQATQVRRYGENIGVLVGAMPQRQWTQPVPVTVAQRSAVSETPDYPRVQVIPRAPGRIHGHAVSDVIHILSELVENATNYSNPNTKVTVGAHRVTAGLAIEINDHGIGMEPEQFKRLNILLRDPSGANVRDLLSQGRIGLSVVAKMAQRHGIAVELQPNVTGGTMALVVIPDALLAPEELPAGDRRQPRRGVDTTQLAAKPALSPITADRIAPLPASAAALSPVAPPARPQPHAQPQPVAADRYAARPGPAETPPPLPRYEEPEADRSPAVLPRRVEVEAARGPALPPRHGGSESDQGSAMAPRHRESEPASEPVLLPRRLEAEVDDAPGPLPDGRPPLRRRTPQGHISSRLLHAQSSEAPPPSQFGALSPTVMSDFWQGLSAGANPTAGADWPDGADRPNGADRPAGAANLRPAEPGYAPRSEPWTAPPASAGSPTTHRAESPAESWTESRTEPVTEPRTEPRTEQRPDPRFPPTEPRAEQHPDPRFPPPAVPDYAQHDRTTANRQEWNQ
ncbi:MAG: ATP-binding protein [Catenulispora sp.]